MSCLHIPQRRVQLEEFNYHALSLQLREEPWHVIGQLNWPSYPYKPEVHFQIVHDRKSIYIHYRVQEEFVKAQYVRTNEAVWEDSCVEFFVSFDGKKSYYNIEFNVLGTGLIGSGSRIKEERLRLDPRITAQIQTASSVVNSAGIKTWCMLLVIPATVFVADSIVDLAGLRAHANFYKCGDGLPTPQFLSWNKIENPTPNFHLPDFFGEIMFE